MRPIHFTEISKNYSLCIKNDRAANPVCVENLLPLKLKKEKTIVTNLESQNINASFCFFLIFLFSLFYHLNLTQLN